MEKSKIQKSSVNIIITIAFIWGLAEAGLGIALKASTGNGFHNALMTGLAFLFFAAAYQVYHSFKGIAILLGVSIVMKLMSALFLNVSIFHPAIINPVFAFCVEALAFVLIVLILNDRGMTLSWKSLIIGGLMALVAVNLFPLAGYVTGHPACKVPGTSYPLSLYYAPMAVGIAAFNFPLGLFAGINIKKLLLSDKLSYRSVVLAFNVMSVIAFLFTILVQI